MPITGVNPVTMPTLIARWKKNMDYAIAIDSPESIILAASRQYNQTKNKKSEIRSIRQRLPKALLLAYRTKDKIRILFRHILQFGLRPIQESFSG